VLYQLTWILGVLRTHVFVACVQHVLVHERRTRRHLPEEGNLDGLANLDSLTLLHENLPRVLAPVLSVEGRYAVLLWMVTLFERLQSRHEVMSSRNTRCHNTLGDTRRDGALDNGSDGVHGSHDLVLELRRHVESDLLEEILGSTKATNH